MASSAATTRPPLVELKNGKIIFKQKAIQLDKHSETLQEIVRFREMLNQSREPILHIPKNHHSLIGKLAHESDKNLHVLSKSIRTQLLPESMEIDESNPVKQFENLLPLLAIEEVLQKVAERVNYGIEQGQYGLTKPPAALCLWRWEVKDPSVLPTQARDKAEGRKLERVAAQKEINAILQPMSPEERVRALGIKNVSNIKDKTNMLPPASSGEATNSTNVSPTAMAKERPPPEQIPAESSKEATKAVAKSQKLMQEEASTKRSAAAFAKFFTKKQTPKAGFLATSSSRGASEEVSSASSDFERTFHPFVLRKNSVMAPPNWFTRRRSNMIVIDPEESRDRSSLSPKALLKENIRILTPGPYPAIRVSKPPNRLKAYTRYSVRDLMDKLADAEVCGDEVKVVHLSKQLRDRRCIPVKILTFADDLRPGYTGTWTRSSAQVGPRTPFAKDLVAFDYSYDSGEEWEEEEEGEEVNSGSDSGEGDASDEDSLDGWLIDDDEDVGGEPIVLDLDMDVDDDLVLGKKRKVSPAPEQNRAKEKKRKVVQPLVPFVKGPCWENTISKSEWDGFRAYRLQFFNNTCGPIDPFTYIPEAVDARTPQYRPNLTGQNISTASERSTTLETKDGVTQWKVPTQAASARLPIFPEEHIQALLQGIQKCKTASLNVLVDTLYQELKKVKVKKNSIERKVREIAEKRVDADAGAKVWAVKMEYLQPGITTI